MEVQILTSNASKLTPENITSATRVLGQIFNTSRNDSSEVKLTRLLKRRGEERKQGLPNSAASPWDAWGVVQVASNHAQHSF